MKRNLIVLLTILVCGLTACKPGQKKDGNMEKETKLKIETSAGDIIVKLYNETPKHRDNFIKLAEEGTYEGTLFHRVIKDFMIQAGDPESKNAPKGKMLGAGDVGYTVPAEFVYPKYFHKKGALSAARQGDNVNPKKESSGCQFYIVTGKVYNDSTLLGMEHQMNQARLNNAFNALAQKHMKENMDSPDYRSKFLKEIAPHLDTDNMFIADVVPYTEQQYQFEVMKGDVDKVNTQTVVVLFLLVNVFLGLIGTFWFRTRRRRNEIALRLAMGSTKKQIFCLLMGEGLLLLTLVALPAMLVCYNVGVAEFIMGHTELITTWPVEWSFLRFLLGSLGAWLLIALMVVTGIWFPARQAIDIQPAEALHEE